MKLGRSLLRDRKDLETMLPSLPWLLKADAFLGIVLSQPK